MPESKSMLFAIWSLGDNKTPLAIKIRTALASYASKTDRTPKTVFMRTVPEGLKINGVAIQTDTSLMSQDIVITSESSIDTVPNTFAKQPKLI